MPFQFFASVLDIDTVTYRYLYKKLFEEVLRHSKTDFLFSEQGETTA